LIGQIPAALGEFIQLQNASLVSIDQTPISLIQPLQSPLNLQLGSWFCQLSGQVVQVPD
jgi:hypothetical protein